MGLFCINPYDESPEAQLKCALGNLDLYIEHTEVGRGGYLLDMARSQIQESIKNLSNKPTPDINIQPNNS